MHTTGKQKTLDGLLVVIKQWGKRTNCTKHAFHDVYLPIALTNFSTSSAFVGQTTTTFNSGYVGDGIAYASSNTILKLGCANSSGTDMCWFLIGYQQWGFNNRTTGNVTIKFPIAFSSECYAVMTGPYSHDTGNLSAQQITKESFYATASAAGDWEYGRWFAVGKQQWGKITRNSASNLSISFPLSCTTTYSVVTTYCDTDKATAEYSIILMNVSGTSFTIYFDPEGGARSEFVYWIMIGEQQWGSNSNLSNTNNWTDITFPISYSSGCYSVCAVPQNISQTNSPNDPMTIQTISKTSFKARMYGTTGMGISYIATGIQQWGDMPSSTNRFTLPIALKTTSYKIMYRYENSSSAAWFDSHSNISARTNTYFDFVTALQREVFVVGWQQWGYTYPNTAIITTTTLTFPISLTEIYAIESTATLHSSTHYDYASSCVVSYSTSNCVLGHYYCQAAFTVIIGKQQWGIKF